MLLLLSRNAFSDGRAEFRLELVFKKTDRNLYDYHSGVLQSLYEDGKLNGLPSWTNPDYISLFARIFQSDLSFEGDYDDWFSAAHCTDNGFKEYTGSNQFDELSSNIARLNKTYNQRNYDLKMRLSESDYLIGGHINLFFRPDTPKNFKDIVRDIFSQKQYPNKPTITERKFWLLDLEQFKNLRTMTALNSESFDRLMYPKRSRSNGSKETIVISNISTEDSAETPELEYKKRAREFYKRKHYKQPIKKSDIVNLSKFNYDIANLTCKRIGDCSYLDLSWGGDFEPDAYELDSHYYGYNFYESNTRCYPEGKSHDFLRIKDMNWISDKNTLYYDGDKNTFETLEGNLDFGNQKIKLNRARKLVNKRLGKESSDISLNRRSGGWKETSKKRNQWMK